MSGEYTVNGVTIMELGKPDLKASDKSFSCPMLKFRANEIAHKLNHYDSLVEALESAKAYFSVRELGQSAKILEEEITKALADSESEGK